jgi:homoserine O-succinyltransferase/O-acetyltransferase
MIWLIRRDIGRFVRGQRETYPAMPQGYFDPVASDALARYQIRITRNPQEAALDSFPNSFVENRLIPMTKPPVVRICSNWLSYLHAHKRPAFRRLGTGA